MKLFKFILKNYIYALGCLLMIFGITLWFVPENALELIEILSPLTFITKLWLLSIFNLMWCLAFIIYDLWELYRDHGIDSIKLDKLDVK